MKIKRYSAASMRAALALVRAEQGPDAVILSSRRGDDGIEVIAAVDYDEALFADAKRQAPSVAAAGMAPAPIASNVPPAQAAPPPANILRPMATARATPAATAATTGAATTPVPARVAPRAAGADYGAMKRELQDMRRLLETGL